MKLLRSYEDLPDAEHLSERLRNRGVMTFISSRRSHNLHRYRTGAFKVGVWAVLPYQFDDAIELLKNKKHKVNNPLSLQEIIELEAEAKYSYANRFNKMAVGFVTWFLILALIVLVGFVAYSMIGNA